MVYVLFIFAVIFFCVSVGFCAIYSLKLLLDSLKKMNGMKRQYQHTRTHKNGEKEIVKFARNEEMEEACKKVVEAKKRRNCLMHINAFIPQFCVIY